MIYLIISGLQNEYDARAVREALDKEWGAALYNIEKVPSGWTIKLDSLGENSVKEMIAFARGFAKGIEAL